MTLLVLNVLVFTAVYYKFNAGKHQQNQNQQHRNRNNGTATTTSTTGGTSSSLRRSSNVKNGSLHRNSPSRHLHKLSSSSPSHIHHLQQLSQQQAEHLLAHHHMDGSLSLSLTPDQQQQQLIQQNAYQISYPESEYGSSDAGGFTEKHSDLHHIYDLQHHQQQHHPTVTFNDYITSQSNHPGIGSSQSMCVKYTSSPSSSCLTSEPCPGNNTTTSNSSSSGSCCHHSVSTSHVATDTTGTASLVGYGYTGSGVRIPQLIPVSGVTTGGIIVSSSNSNGISNQSNGVNPCDKNCLTVIHELDDDEHNI